MTVTTSPLLYLKQQLQFQLKEWTDLSEKDKDWYKEAARREIELTMGVVKEVKE